MLLIVTGTITIAIVMLLLKGDYCNCKVLCTGSVYLAGKYPGELLVCLEIRTYSVGQYSTALLVV